MSLFSRIFGGASARDRYRPLYARIVALGRDPYWYREGRVPDTIDGRFDMIAAILALVLLRLETEGAAAADASALLAETFIEDMDGSIRQIGIGDLMVGKQVGKMMSALGGRISAFRASLADGTGFAAAVERNIFHDAPPDTAAVAAVSARLESFQRRLAGTDIHSLLAGDLP